jgi:prolyl-tRNA synthetase
MADLSVSVGKLLDDFQAHLYQRALDFRAANSVSIDTWDDFTAVFADQGSKFVWAHWDGSAETEAAIKAATKATVRCIPLEGQGPPAEPGKCVKTGAASAQRVLFAKNY